MADERKYRIVYDAIFLGVPVLLVIVGIYFMRSPRVVVLNMDKVAQDTGVADRIRENERRLMGERLAQVEETNARARAQVAALEAQLGRDADATARKNLQEQIRRVRADAQLTAERARQDIQQYHEGMRREFRAKIDPVVARIAGSWWRRYDIVIDSWDGRALAYVRGSVDITDEVIRDARSVLAGAEFGALNMPAPKPAAAPHTEAGKPAGTPVKK